MNRITGKVLALVATALISASSLSEAAEVFIDITRKQSSLIRLAVPEFQFRPTAARKDDPNKLGNTAKEVLKFDLGFSGYFEVIESDEYIETISKKEDPEKINWTAWKDLGTSALVKGIYYVNTDGDMVIEARLFDVERREQIIGVRYTGSQRSFRKMVHRLSDQVIYRFSGETGISETRIAFISRTNGHKELLVADYDGHDIKQITNDEGITLSPAWSPDGKKILFTTYKYRNPDIYGIDLTNGDRFPVSRKIGLNSTATWSPDGKKIAFSMSTDGNTDIYIMNSDGTDIKRLTYTQSIETSPSFSPDGSRIAYTSDFSGTPQIYIMSSDGTNKERFTFSGDYNTDPAWSPKGDEIAYSSLVDDNFNIVVKSVDGRYERQLTAFISNNESPTWSPDGRYIAFTSSSAGSKQIFLITANGLNMTQVTNLPGGTFSPAWAPRENSE